MSGHGAIPLPPDPPGRVVTAATTCAQCGVAWSLDNRSDPCPMTCSCPHLPAGRHTDACRHLFAQGVTALEVERLRRIERAATAVVRAGAHVVSSHLLDDLRAALESK